MNENLIAICEKYGYNIPKANEQVLNRYIKDILEDLSESVPTLKEKVPTNLTMKQKDALKKEGKEPETDLNGNVLLPRFKCVTSHTARRTGITNMYLRQIRHRPDDAHQRPQNAENLHGLHLTGLPLAVQETLLRGDSRRNRRPNQERQRDVVIYVCLF